jgi:crotonobetainyl-CoA:carnitine CoA-transferase CaiB-like acyl-CoA transferase
MRPILSALTSDRKDQHPTYSAVASRRRGVSGLLNGMRVLDLSAWRPMPHATQILADLGAEVLKVEPPGGDPMRGYPEIFASVARGKRSIVLDLRRDEGRERALTLAAEADVVCESWRPGVADRLGIGFETVAAANPSVIYCSLTGFGQDGPLRDVPGHDVNFQAIAGALAPRPGEDPEISRLPVADLEGGTVCAVLICAAWARRIASGVGERIDVAMADVVAWWVGTHSGVANADAAAESPSGARAVGSPGYGVYRTADDQWISLGVLAEPRLWEAICGALAVDELALLTFAERLARTNEINATLAERIRGLTAAVALDRLVTAGAPATPVLTPEEATRHPQLRGRGFHVDTDEGLVARLPGHLASDGMVAPSGIAALDADRDGFRPRP